VENGAQERRELERAVIVDCRACRTLCEQTLELLLGDSYVARDDDVVRLVMSCAAVAETTAVTIDDGERQLAAALLEFCADSCETAAAALESHTAHAVVRECTDTCRACADTVRALLWAAFEDG
jgi:hypothetical protein